MSAPTIEPGYDPTPPPEDWIDWVAVELTVKGQKVHRPLTRAERNDAIRKMIAAGYGPTLISNRLRCNGKRAKELIAEATGKKP